MQIQTDVSLKDYSTMRLGGNAAHLAHVHSEEELIQGIEWAAGHNLPVLMIGGGSNILWRDEGFNGLILVNRLPGFTIEDKGDNRFYVTVGAGEPWDSVVARTTAKGLTGIENLSLIPGTAGATPIQNVGAYYQDISDTLVQVTAYDTQTRRMVTLTKEECELSYRSSRFKTKDHGRFFITSITLHLEKRHPQPPFYPSLQQYLDDHNITTYTPAVIRDAIISVRSAKLPDPAKVANNGSFFANPMIPQRKLDELQEIHGTIMHWPAGEGAYKIPAAWLVQEAGFRGFHDPETGMATWPTQAIVLVNEHAKNTADALKFKQKIVDAVEKQFGIILEQEPVLL